MGENLFQIPKFYGIASKSIDNVNNSYSNDSCNNNKNETLITSNSSNALQEKLNIEYKKYWETKIQKEEKKTYHDPHPDMITEEKIQNKDLDKYNLFDKNDVSSNYLLFLFFPVEIEHTIYAPP